MISMKKAIIGLSGLVILSFVVLLFVNAQNSPDGAKKAATEVSANCAKCPSTAACTTMGEAKTAACNPAKCKEMGCDPAKCKEGKCDPATCKATCTATAAKGGMKGTAPANCTSACPMMTAAKK